MSHRFTSALVVLAAALPACSRAEKPAVDPAPDVAPATAVDPQHRSTAVLAGGCFWGMEELLRAVPGVLETTVGYTGGSVARPRYEDVSSGKSGHAESIQIVFDGSKVSYEEILLTFFKIHDPTTKHRQGNDVGSQYRSAIFVRDADQRRVAEQVKRRVDASGAWRSPVVTEIVDATEFFPAEAYHQDYLRKNPGGYTCHYARDIESY